MWLCCTHSACLPRNVNSYFANGQLDNDPFLLEGMVTPLDTLSYNDEMVYGRKSAVVFITVLMSFRALFKLDLNQYFLIITIGTPSMLFQSLDPYNYGTASAWASRNGSEPKK